MIDVCIYIMNYFLTTDLDRLDVINNLWGVTFMVSESFVLRITWR